ncbi:hypothetical protein A2U01_0076662, partial [Trifolium medium]|nr:hypothetical protein [Trifolium medium]
MMASGFCHRGTMGSIVVRSDPSWCDGI